MSLQKGMLIGAGVLCALGLILRVVGVAFGLDLMILGTFAAVIALSFVLRTTQNQLSTTRRSITQRLRDADQAQVRQQEAIDELATLQRTTLWYVKNRTGANVPTTELAGSLRGTPRLGLAGRSSTPDVTNAAAGVSFASALDPERTTTIGGVFSAESREFLPAGTTVKPFIPYRAVESFEAGGPFDLVVIDEAELAHDPWARSVGPAGITMMKDLLEAVHVAREQGVQTVILPFDSVPDIHSTAFRSVPVLRLPLGQDVSSQASGAPLTPVLGALEQLAARRRSV